MGDRWWRRAEPHPRRAAHHLASDVMVDLAHIGEQLQTATEARVDAPAGHVGPRPAAQSAHRDRGPLPTRAPRVPRRAGRCYPRCPRRSRWRRSSMSSPHSRLRRSAAGRRRSPSSPSHGVGPRAQPRLGQIFGVCRRMQRVGMTEVTVKRTAVDGRTRLTTGKAAPPAARDRRPVVHLAVPGVAAARHGGVRGRRPDHRRRAGRPALRGGGGP